MDAKDLKKLTSAELVEIYNTHATKPITRFSDRKAALRRTAALLEELNVQAKPKVDAPTPKPLANAHRKSKAAVLVAKAKTPNEVKEYKTVRAAFEALVLPIGIMRRFRKDLKLAGKKEIDGFVFHATYKD